MDSQQCKNQEYATYKVDSISSSEEGDDDDDMANTVSSSGNVDSIETVDPVFHGLLQDVTSKS